MSFLETVRQAKAYLEEQGRVSLNALQLEFDLDRTRLDALVEELVEVQQVAAREGKLLSWIGSASSKPEPPQEPTQGEDARRNAALREAGLE